MSLSVALTKRSVGKNLLFPIAARTKGSGSSGIDHYGLAKASGRVRQRLVDEDLTMRGL